MFYRLKFILARYEVLAVIAVKIGTDAEIEPAVPVGERILHGIGNDRSGHFRKDISDFSCAVRMGNGVQHGDDGNGSGSEKGVGQQTGGYFPAVFVKRAEIRKSPDGFRRYGNVGIDCFHYLYHVIPGGSYDDHPDKLGGQGGVCVVYFGHKIMSFPTVQAVGAFFAHGKPAYLIAFPAGIYKSFHVAYVGINGSTQKRQPVFGGAYHILPEIIGNNKVADRNDDNAEKQYHGDGA